MSELKQVAEAEAKSWFAKNQKWIYTAIAGWAVGHFGLLGKLLGLVVHRT